MKSKFLLFFLLAYLSNSYAGFFDELLSPLLQNNSVNSNDPCNKNELKSPGAITWFNSTVGQDNGLSEPVVSVNNLQSADGANLVFIMHVGKIANAPIVCHADFQTNTNQTLSGVFSIYDQGNYSKLQIGWISDIEIAERWKKINQIDVNNVDSVTPFLNNSKVESCVGKNVALDFHEQWQGQIWMYCADQLGLLKH